MIGRQLTAQRTKRRRYPCVLPWTPGWDVAACGGNGGPGKSAASWSGGPPREEWKADRLVSASRLVAVTSSAETARDRSAGGAVRGSRRRPRATY
jgi:hypothetical protein